MRQTFITLLCLIGSVFFYTSQAAEIVVPGISGVTFDDEVPSVTLTTDFTVQGLTVSPQALTMTYNADVFKIFGDAIVKIGTDEIGVSFGNESNPGLQITNGSFDQVSMGISANFVMKSLTVQPNGLSFEWDNVNSVFEIYGAASVSFDNESMTVGLGDADNAGIQITNGALTKLGFEVTADFNLKNLSFSPDAFTFEWDSSSDKIEMYGGATVSFDSESIEIGLGDADSPGIEIGSGIIEKLNLGVSADFSMKSISFSPDNLTFAWDSSTDKVEMYGGAEVSFDSESMTIGLGDADTPGIEIGAGVVEKLNLSVSADFNMKSLSFSPDNLTFEWDSSSDKIEMYGGATVSFDSESFTVGLGDSDNPGILVSSGVVEQVSLAVSADFSMKSMNFSPDGLGFAWDKNSQNFEMFGAATLSFDGQSIEVDLGDSDDPGIEVSAGVIQGLNMGITTEFDMKGMTFTSDGLTFQWDKNSDHIEMFGSASTSFDGESIEVTMGSDESPGIVINNGVVSHINLGVSADFKLKTLEYEAQGLTYHWDKNLDRYEIYGSTVAKFSGEEIDISLGDNSNPGIVVKNKVITRINMGLTADFDLKSMSFKPDNLTFHYDKNQSRFEIYGSADLDIEGHQTGISLGTNSNPGLVFKDNDLKHINLSITEDFMLKGLTVKTDDAGVTWDKSTNHFNFYGDIDLEIASESIDADMGTSSDPGMQFRNGKLHSFDVVINSDFKVGNLEVITRDVEVNYKNSKFYMTGEIEVDEVFSVIVDLGEDGSNGLEIDVAHHPDKLKLNDFKIEVDHVDMGAVDFKKVEISFKNDVIHEAEVDVSFPPGYEVDATLTFEGTPAKLNSVDISYDATSLQSSIQVGNTGLALVHIEGGMFNLANPSTPEIVVINGIPKPVTGVYFKGSVAFTYGGPVSLAGKSAALIYNKDEAIITGQEANLSASLLVGAYRQNASTWHSILGSGSISMDFIWGRSYSVNAFMKIPSDPLVEFTARAKLSTSGYFDALMRVKLKVPHSIPIIGGKTLGSVDGAIRYNKRYLNDSYGAGWATYKFFGKHHVGARYTFGTRKVAILGTKKIDAIKSQVNRELSSSANLSDDRLGAANLEFSSSNETEWFRDVRTFELPANNTSILVELDFGEQIDEAYVSVIGPSGLYDVYEIHKTDKGEDVPPKMEMGGMIRKFESDSAANLLIVNHAPEIDSLEYQYSTMAPGQYDVFVSYRSTDAVDSLGFRSHYFYPTATAEISAETGENGTVNLGLDYWAHIPDSTSISVYWNDTLAYGGYHIATLDYGQPDENGFGRTDIQFTPNQVAHSDELYFYYVVQDSTNVPVYSDFSRKIDHSAHVEGIVEINNSDNELVAGIMIFIDENEDGFYDTFRTAGKFEPSVITDALGSFHFNGLTIGETYTIDIVVPFGYSLADGETGKRTFTYDGVQQLITFEIEKD